MNLPIRLSKWSSRRFILLLTEMIAIATGIHLNSDRSSINLRYQTLMTLACDVMNHYVMVGEKVGLDQSEGCYLWIE